MSPTAQIDRGRLCLHWTGAGSLTTSYPVETGADEAEATDIRDQVAPGAGLHCWDNWEPRALALDDLRARATPTKKPISAQCNARSIQARGASLDLTGGP